MPNLVGQSFGRYQILELHRCLPAVRTPKEKDMLKREIDSMDTQIDQLVYELYGLTD
jgi:hypothetical protein